MNLAREADKKRHVREAISLYETLVSSGKAELTDLLNLIVLYFYCMDLGYASACLVGKDIEKIASSRALELVSLAEKQYGTNDEFLYWRYMIPYYGWGEPVPKWNLQGNSNMPYLYLAMENPTAENLQYVRELAIQVSDIEESKRKGYILGKIEQMLHR